MAESTTLRDHRVRIERVLRHVEEHLDEPLDVPTLAHVGSCATFHFHRVFRAVVGEPVMAYVRRLRLERAARELKQSDAKIVEVALRAGFDAHEAFSRAFSSHFGVSPSEYRKTHAANVSSPPEVDFARVVVRPACEVITARHVGPYETVGETWSRLFRALPGSADVFGLCWDDPEVTDPTHFRYDACAAVEVFPHDLAERGLSRRTLPRGRFAVAIHRGPYATLASSYGNLTRWMLERDLVPGEEPSVERYRVGPPSKEEEKFETEIALRIDG
jgi:AraC family transcriptional regulator